MSDRSKSERPAATGRNATDQIKHPQNLPPAQIFSKMRDELRGDFRRRPNYLIQRNREVLACLADADAADRFLAKLGGRDGL